jgi:uncharacterized protein YgfB (UPF0149 family)
VSDLTALALNAAHQLPVAELHGAVCGLGVCHGEATPVSDLVALLGVEALTDQASVESFVAASVEALEAEDMSFAPLLPGDDTALADRLEALGQWCGSFLAGFAAGLARRGAGSLDDCPEEVREIVRDFSAIAQVDADEAAEAAGAEAAEGDFVELEEFVKVGTLLIMSSLGSSLGSDPEAGPAGSGGDGGARGAEGSDEADDQAG